MADDVDSLLKSYLEDASDKQRSSAARQQYSTGPELPAVRRAIMRNLTDELGMLLDRYLETKEPQRSGSGTLPAFTLPRKPEVDVLLRRYREGGGGAVDAEELRRQLSDHVEAVDSTRRAVGSTLDLEQHVDEHSWTQRTASDVHRHATFEEKIASYADALDNDERDEGFIDDEVQAPVVDDEDESLYAFEPETATIQGMPPGNAPPPKKKKR